MTVCEINTQTEVVECIPPPVLDCELSSLNKSRFDISNMLSVKI